MLVFVRCVVHHALLSSCVAILDREQVWAVFQLHPKTGIHSVSLRTLPSLHLLLQGVCVCVCVHVCVCVWGGGLGADGQCVMVPRNCIPQNCVHQLPWQQHTAITPPICTSVAMATTC